MSTAESIRAVVGALLPEAQELLQALIACPSTPGREKAAMAVLEQAFAGTGAGVEPVPLSDAIRQDPDYSDPVPDLTYEGRGNLRVLRRGSGGGRALLLNTHLDVVPPSEGQVDPWGGREQDGAVYGRGACDAKGQAATVFLVFRALERLALPLEGDLMAHLVVEEENGGNGTLAMVRRGECADGAVILEPSDRKLYTSIRGAVWFRLLLRGKAGHSGQAGQTRSALLMARDAMGILERYHARLLAASRGIPLFDAYPNPMPLTFGRLQAGNWPASAPNQASLEGVLGLLPNKTRDQVCEEMRQALSAEGDPGLAANFDLQFMYRHDSSVLDPGHALPQALLEAAREAGVHLAVSGMTASCDAWFYNNLLGIPAVVYGPGSLGVAHAADEHIRMADIAEAAETLVGLVHRFCRAPH